VEREGEGEGEVEVEGEREAGWLETRTVGAPSVAVMRVQAGVRGQ
jgi:hypothetical protein